MIATLKKCIYTAFVRRFQPYQFHVVFKHAAFLLERLLGLVPFHYHGLRLLVGPMNYHDRFVMLGKAISPVTTTAIAQYLVDGDVFLDIGAHHGVLSLLASKNPNVDVYAFEPSPRERERLEKNRALNATHRITVFSQGVSNIEGERMLTLAPKENTGMNSLPAIQTNGQQVTCQFAPLYALLSADMLKRTRLCKIDVEGQEMLILNSLRAHRALFQQCVFVIEISPRLLPKLGFHPDDIYDYFTEAGFEYAYGPQTDFDHWDEVFYHPDYNATPQYVNGMN